MNVLFLDQVHEVLALRLSQAGWSCDENYTCSYHELVSLISGYDGLVIRSRLPIDAKLLESTSRLKFIARSGAGLENIDLEAAEKKNIKIFNSPEGNRDAVGEHAIGMLLMLINNLNRADFEVRHGIWKREENRGSELAGRTVGIIGYGNMGSAFAKKLSGFDCRVIVYDEYKELHPTVQVEQVDLQTLQRESDVISLHIPDTPETRHMIDDAFITACSKAFILINTARGIHVDTSALTRGLESGAVSGACLDVLEYEKKSFEGLSNEQIPGPLQYLLASDRVVLSPHIAGWTHESYIKLSSVLADKILAEFRG